MPLSRFRQRIELVTLVTFIFVIPLSQAEIYRWVDDKGNVHFGDRAQAEQARSTTEQVELREGYKPTTTLTEQEQRILEQEQATRTSLNARREEEREKADQDRIAAAERELAKRKECDRYQELYRELSGMQIVGGRQTRYYLTDDEGNSLSAAQQQEEVERLKAHAEKAGCSLD